MSSSVLVVDLDPAYVPLRFRRGDHVALSYQIAEDGVEPDITGDVVSAEIRVTADSGSVSATFTTDVTTLGSDGIFVLSLTDSDTAEMYGEYQWDVEWTRASDGRVVTLVGGPVEVSKDVTQ